MNPEEGELRPQLLDRFGLTVEVAATRDPAERVEVVRARGSPTRPTRPASPPLGTTAERELGRADRRRPATLLPEVRPVRRRAAADRRRLRGLRRRRHARRPGHGPHRDRARRLVAAATVVTAEDVRAAARLALPHRRRRNPFDAPGPRRGHSSTRRCSDARAEDPTTTRTRTTARTAAPSRTLRPRRPAGATGRTRRRRPADGRRRRGPAPADGAGPGRRAGRRRGRRRGGAARRPVGAAAGPPSRSGRGC